MTESAAQRQRGRPSKAAKTIEEAYEKEARRLEVQGILVSRIEPERARLDEEAKELARRGWPAEQIGLRRREALAVVCRELTRRGLTLAEAQTLVDAPTRGPFEEAARALTNEPGKAKSSTRQDGWLPHVVALADHYDAEGEPDPVGHSLRDIRALASRAAQLLREGFKVAGKLRGGELVLEAEDVIAHPEGKLPILRPKLMAATQDGIRRDRGSSALLPKVPRRYKVQAGLNKRRAALPPKALERREELRRNRESGAFVEVLQGEESRRAGS